MVAKKTWNTTQKKKNTCGVVSGGGAEIRFPNCSNFFTKEDRIQKEKRDGAVGAEVVRASCIVVFFFGREGWRGR